MKSNTKTSIKIINLSEDIPLSKVIQKRDCFIPEFFSVMMNQIIKTTDEPDYKNYKNNRQRL